MGKPRYGYAGWEDSEHWHGGDFTTREDAAEEAFDNYADADTVWTCEAHPIDVLPSLVEGFDVDRGLEFAEEHLGDNVCNWVEGEILNHTPEALACLRAALTAALTAWLAKYPVTTWQAEAMQSHDRPTGDAEADRG